MSKLAVNPCPRCGVSHRLTVRELDPPVAMLKARAHSFATCPVTKEPILQWSYDGSNEVVWPEGHEG